MTNSDVPGMSRASGRTKVIKITKLNETQQSDTKSVKQSVKKSVKTSVQESVKQTVKQSVAKYWQNRASEKPGKKCR